MDPWIKLEGRKKLEFWVFLLLKFQIGFFGEKEGVIEVAKRVFLLVYQI